MTKNDGLEQAKAHLSGIFEGYEAFLALEEGAEFAEYEGEKFDDVDALRERLEELPLSLETKRDWRAVGDPDTAATHFRILLGTGGPACQIVGELSADGEPENATIQGQDWFEPWRDYRPESEEEADALLWFAGLFFWGEG